jgi:hypothetical protein
MSSVWTPSIDEKSLSRAIIKNESTDHNDDDDDDDDDNSNISHITGTTATSISSHSRSSLPNSSIQTNHSHEQHRNPPITFNSIYSEVSASTPVNNVNTVSSNDLQQEQCSSAHGLFERNMKINTKQQQKQIVRLSFILGASSFSGQLIRSDPQTDQLVYFGTTSYYDREMANGIDPLQQHHPSQNYSHFQQRNYRHCS